MKPYPFASLNHFTTPVATGRTSLDGLARALPSGAQMMRRYRRFVFPPAPSRAGNLSLSAAARRLRREVFGKDGVGREGA